MSKSIDKTRNTGRHAYLMLVCALAAVSFAAVGCDDKDAENTSASLVNLLSENAGANCQGGGIKVISGLDQNGNGILEEAEIQSSQYICNGDKGVIGDPGENGEDGTNGKSVLSSASSNVGDHCANGGIRFDVGRDDNGDGVLDEAEILSSEYICNGNKGQNGQNGENGQNGANATIQTTTFAGEQHGCANGGIQVDMLMDGVVQDGQTKYICNGANGQDGLDGQNGANATIQTTTFAGEQHGCANGGIQVDMLMDGVVQEGQTKYICNGANGHDGLAGEKGTDATIQTMTFTGEQHGCANGGIQVDVLKNGTVQTEEDAIVFQVGSSVQSCAWRS